MTMTPEEMQAELGRMIRDNQRMAGVLHRAAGQFANTIDATEDSRKKAARKLQSDMQRQAVDRATLNFTNNVKQLTINTESFGNAIETFVNGIIGGAAINAVINQVRSLSDTYQSLNEVGQTFSGSMFEMARQAGAAGLSLSDFAKIISTASSAAAVLGRNGQGGLPMLALEVRKNIREFGNYGYSLEQVLELTGEYAETLRLQGQLDDTQRAQAGRSITALAEDIATFSVVTGKSRREIAQATQAALRDVAVSSRAMLGLSEQQRRGMDQATAFLASIPGDAGQLLSTFFAQSIGYGTSLYTDATQTFVQAGFSQAVSLMDNAQQRVAAGLEEGGEVMREFAADFVREADANIHGLRTQAMAGNENAKRVLEIARQMRVVSNMSARQIDEMRRQAREREALTQFATTFNDVFSEIIGAFKDGFYAQLVEVTKSLQSFISQGGITAMAARFKTLGERVGGLIARILTPQNIQTFADNLHKFVSGLITAVSNFADSWTIEGVFTALGAFVEGILAATKIAFAFIEGLGIVVGWMNQLANGIASFVQYLSGGLISGENVSWFIGIVAAVGTAFGALLLTASALKRAFDNLTGRIAGPRGQVQILGGGGNDGGGRGGPANGGPGGTPGGGRGGVLGRVAAAGAGALAVGATVLDAATGLGLLDRLQGGPAASNASPDPARPGQASPPGAEPARPPTAAPTTPDTRPNATMPDGRPNPWHQATPPDAARPAGTPQDANERVSIGQRLRNAARVGGQGIVRAAPLGIGLGLAGVTGAALASEGDHVGAALTTAAGAAGVVPGYGTAASLGLTGLSMLREVVGRDSFDSNIGNFVMRQLGGQTRETQAQAEHNRQMDQEMARLQGGVQRELDNLARQLEQQRTEVRQSREAEQETQRLMREQTELLRLQNALTGGLGRQQLDAARQQLRVMQQGE